MPLTQECKKILNFAGEEAERLVHRHIGPEHLLLGILRVEGSMAAQILVARGLQTAAIREKLAKTSSPQYQATEKMSALLTLDNFLSGLKLPNSEALMAYFAKNAVFIDADGKRWNHEEIFRGFETLFAPYGKKNANYALEGAVAETNEVFVASVLWKNAILASEQREWMHRMTVILLSHRDDWEIVLAQVTPVKSF
jgi:ketosteroid isomerase-like protein